MSQLDEALASPEWAFALAAALETQLGDERILTVGSARDDSAEVAGDETTRVVALNFTTGDGERGSIALVAFASFAEALERAASDEILLTTCAAALDGAVRVIGEQAVAELETEPAREIDREVLADGPSESEAVYPLLDGSSLLGLVMLRVGTASTAGASVAPSPTTEMDTPAGGDCYVATGASYVLADVEMGVTAELGRCRMTVRELLSITPGAVIDLDRAAGAPVDVLVNGTLIARGEVVVIDEEFGIRISELIPQPAAAR